MGKSYYFPHDYDSLNDDKILMLRSKYGVEGYGVFWMILETMAKRGDGTLIGGLLGGLSIGYGVAIDRLIEIIDYCVEIELFNKKDNVYFSSRMIEHLKLYKSFSKYGLEGANRRWKNKGGNAPPISPPNANKIKENKIKENKIKDSNKGKIKHLDFVYLTTEEHLKLINRFTDKGAQERIERLNNYIGSKGKRYKSHYHTILNWEGKNNGSDRPGGESGVKQFTGLNEKDYTKGVW